MTVFDIRGEKEKCIYKIHRMNVRYRGKVIHNDVCFQGSCMYDYYVVRINLFREITYV